MSLYILNNPNRTNICERMLQLTHKSLQILQDCMYLVDGGNKSVRENAEVSKIFYKFPERK